MPEWSFIMTPIPNCFGLPKEHPSNFNFTKPTGRGNHILCFVDDTYMITKEWDTNKMKNYIKDFPATHLDLWHSFRPFTRLSKRWKRDCLTKLVTYLHVPCTYGSPVTVMQVVNFKDCFPYKYRCVKVTTDWTSEDHFQKILYKQVIKICFR